MTKAIAQTYSVFNQNIKLISYVMMAGCLLLAIIYTLNIFAVISNTVAFQKIDKQIVLLNSNVDELDASYLALSSSINPDDLGQYGMTKGKVSQYITRSSSLEIGLTNQFNHVALINER